MQHFLFISLENWFGSFGNAWQENRYATRPLRDLVDSDIEISWAILQIWRNVSLLTRRDWFQKSAERPTDKLQICTIVQRIRNRIWFLSPGMGETVKCHKGVMMKEKDIAGWLMLKWTWVRGVFKGFHIGKDDDFDELRLSKFVQLMIISE